MYSFWILEWFPVQLMSYSSGFVEDGTSRHQTSGGEKNVALSFSLSENTFCHPRVSAGATFLFRSLFLRPVLEFWSTGTTLMGTRVTLRWTFLSRIFSGVMYILRIERCALVPRMLDPSVKSNWISAAQCPGIRNLTGILQ